MPLKQLKDHKQQNNNFVSPTYKPIFFRLISEKDKRELKELLEREPQITICDELHGQLKELIKLKYPKQKLDTETSNKYITEHLKGVSPDYYGVWVYYPWLLRLVHILDEQEFIEVRTNRNQYKITPEERQFLSTQKIGVIGLSVGQSISLTLALERSFGELRIADFDILELSNLNRIRSGLSNLGIKKTICVAREIAEIDPYLKVTLFSEGITEENINNFFLEGGKLNIVVDECDGLDIKVLCRHKAKELKIPVFMESSDRGTIDVERFDLEPNRSILHGLIDHLDHSKLKYLKTNEEKIPYILPMLGTDTISKRMKASMLEIEQTITTWPQLASSVVFGGGIGADICRRIMLNQFHESGRYIVDMEELVGNKKTTISEFNNKPTIPPISKADMMAAFDKIFPTISKEREHLNHDTLSTILKYACLAPTMGNNQPWKWFYKNGCLLLLNDTSISKSFGDYDNIGTNVGMGACIENLHLIAHKFQLEVNENIFPLGEDSNVIGCFTFTKSETKQPTDYLVDYIEQRCTNRVNEKRTSVDNSAIEALKQIAGSIPGATLHIAQTEKELNLLKEITACSDRLRFLHPEGHSDFFNKEIRWSKEECEEKRDGLDISAFDLTPSEIAGFKIASDPEAVKLTTLWEKGTAFEKMTRKAIDSASFLAFLTMPKYNKGNYILGGRSVQRVWLEATKRKLDIQPILASLFLFTRLSKGKGDNMSDKMIAEVKELRKDFLTVFPIKENMGEIFLFKVSPATELKVRSLRKPVNSVLTIDE